MHRKNIDADRRKWLKAFTAISGAIALGGFSSFKSTANTGDYRALVYIFLEGGNDAFNTLVPLEPGVLRNRYETGRAVVALPADQLHPLTLQRDAKIYDGLTYNGFGLHPSCQKLATLFNQNELSFITNVGTAVRPITREQYLDKSVETPPQLFSHSDQQRQYQSEPTFSFNYGWGGRCSEFLSAFNISSNISPLISTSGLNPFQVSLGGEKNTYVMKAQGRTNLISIPNDIRNLVTSYSRDSVQSTNLISAKFAETLRSAELAVEVMDGAFNIANQNGVDYDGVFASHNAAGTSVGQQLKSIAKMIAGREANSNQRPIYYVKMSGFDNHQNLLSDHAQLLSQLDNAIAAFRDVLIAQDDFDKTLSFVGSEFGRTFTPNGDDTSAGTDHGWGGHAMAFGGMIKGGHLFGEHPDLALDQGLDVAGTRGRWIPTTSVAQCCAPIAKWMGVSDADLPSVFPSLNNFASPFDLSTNLDFIKG